MYFPYVYGRASELLALRSMLSDSRPLDLMVPVVEPVRDDISRLLKCVEEFEKKGLPLAVVFNPDKYELKDGDASKEWRKKMHPELLAASHVIPVLRCHSNIKSAAVAKFLTLFKGREVAIAHASSTLTDAEVSTLVADKNVRFHMVLNQKISSTQLKLLPKAKRVDIDDYFNKLDRNADYGGPELFTDKYKTFKSTGVGFGDYAAIGSAFTPGGGQPAAIAIHAIYKHPKTADIWMEHFVSNDKTAGVVSVEAKFIQAATKLVNATKKRPTEFGSNFALDRYAAQVAAGKSPGLPKNKELQIAHHICVMLDVLSGRL